MRNITTLPDGTTLVRGDKHKNGNALDGKRHETDPFPKRLTVAEKRDTPALTSAERKQWQTALKIIDKGWKTFVEVGVALQEVRQSRLYREDYGSWEAFCNDVVGISKTEANRQITDAKVVDDLKAPIGAIAGECGQPPSNRSQVRALARLKKPEERREAWRKVRQRAERTGIPITAEIVNEAVEAIRRSEDSPPSSSPARPVGVKSVTSASPLETAMDVIERLRVARRAKDWEIVDEVIEHLQAAEL